jgi:hypothetical protein
LSRERGESPIELYAALALLAGVFLFAALTVDLALVIPTALVGIAAALVRYVRG